MKRLIILFILALFVVFSNIVSAESKITATEYKVIADDGFILYSTLKYPKIKNKNEYPTVVLLHSLGYNSEWWEDLPQLLLDQGYAVITIDMRGHGKSVYNSKLYKTSWVGLNDKAFQKYPKDVVKILEQIKSENKKIFFNNWAIVGCDVGAATGIIAANNFADKPSTIVMISPVIKGKGLYIPVALAELDNTDILAIHQGRMHKSILNVLHNQLL